MVPEINSKNATVSDIARTASAPIISFRLEMRSTIRPAGMESKRNGIVWPVCSKAVSLGPALSNSTAASGAAASAVCSENCAHRFVRKFS